jgi:hypothetical protein
LIFKKRTNETLLAWLERTILIWSALFVWGGSAYMVHRAVNVIVDKRGIAFCGLAVNSIVVYAFAAGVFFMVGMINVRDFVRLPRP